jgi:hypothetical protein
LIDGWILIREFNKTTPLTRDSVLVISVAVAGIALVLGLASVSFNTQAIHQQSDVIYQQTNLISRTSDILSDLTHAVRGLSDYAKDSGARLDALENRPLEVEKPTGLLNAIRRLLGN